MKYIYFLLIFSSCVLKHVEKPGQECDCWSDTTFKGQGLTYVLKDSGETSPDQNELIDPRNERAIKDTFINWGDGSQPSCYWQVQYDYGKPSADYFQIMRWVLGDSVPKCFNGWQIEMKDVWNSGPQESEYWDDHIIVSFYNPYHRSKLQKYSEDIYISSSKIEVIQNKDTLDKYMKIEYPYAYDPLRSRWDKK